MAIITASELKAYAKETTSGNDAQWTFAVNAANTWVPRHCLRSFASVDTDASERRYTPESATLVRIHDAHEVTAVAISGGTLDASSYQLEPLNQLNMAEQYRPYDRVRLIYAAFDTCRTEATVTVTAKWGWNAVPDDVKLATLILGADLYRNREMRFGVISATEFAGVRARANPQVLELLSDFRRDELSMA